MFDYDPLHSLIYFREDSPRRDKDPTTCNLTDTLSAAFAVWFPPQRKYAP